MPFLLDTNILSELRKGERCDSNVSKWAAKESEQSHYICVLSLGEIRKGIELLRKKSPTCPATRNFRHSLLAYTQRVHRSHPFH